MNRICNLLRTTLAATLFADAISMTADTLAQVGTTGVSQEELRLRDEWLRRHWLDDAPPAKHGPVRPFRVSESALRPAAWRLDLRIDNKAAFGQSKRRMPESVWMNFCIKPDNSAAAYALRSRPPNPSPGICKIRSFRSLGLSLLRSAAERPVFTNRTRLTHPRTRLMCDNRHSMVACKRLSFFAWPVRDP